MQTDIQAYINNFFEYLNIEIDSLDLQHEQNQIIIKLQTPDSGIVIGPHGKTLDAITSLLRQSVNNLCEDKTKIRLEINDYESSKDQRLFSFIQKKVDFLKSASISEIQLPYYSAYERKKVHSYIANLKDDTLYTKSMGEDKQRRIYLGKKAPKLTIDIDGDDI